VDQATKIVEGIQSVIADTTFQLQFATNIEQVQGIGAEFATSVGTVIGGGTAPAPVQNPFGGILGSINTSSIMAPAGNTVSTSSVNINVNGGDPNAVVSALRSYMRQNGSVPIKISNAY
jgi:amino acid permease